MPPILTVTEGPDKGQVFKLRSERITIGRDPMCDIRLNDMQVSRQHAGITLSEAVCEILDMNSSNGTMVNGRVIVRHPLAEGDVVLLGNTRLAYHIPVPVAPSWALSKGETQTITLDARGLFTQWPEREDVESLKRAKTDLEALYRVGRTLSSILETFHLLPKVLDIIFAEIPAVDRGSIYLLEPGSGKSVCKTARYRAGRGPDGEAILNSAMAGQAIKEKRAILTFDAESPESDGGPEAPVRSAICAPLQSQDKIVGFIYADSRQADPLLDHDDLRLLAAIGLQAGAAIENARLYERLAYDKAALHVANQELKLAQEKLIQSEKLAAVGRLASGLIHDIRNPMTIVLGYTSLIREKLKRHDSEALRSLHLDDHLRDIEEGVNYSNEVMEQLLKFARPSPPAKTEVDINALVESTLKFMHHETTRAGVTVYKQFKEDLPLLMADANQIKQVFINIVLNAVQAMDKPNPLLKVMTDLIGSGRSRFIRVAFQDNGRGMTEEQRKRVFEPFFSTKTGGAGPGGTGLGMSISYGLVNSHGGSIAVLSELGAGTTFRVLLPAGTVDVEPTWIGDTPAART
jgi:two-component system NtrC family sensor kinase